ncbi:Sodium/hydrogen exchanger family-domain-containing protein [Mycena alexandri]|uniref:Sodium/hydrogen exchanger family-domain-containing protein n=1 Tax=Mycena alexandri TaxID=1745969 RepID=A0AAD6S7D0_9AGAR|nr:Sodium/hydrogen exchanger family-domain-containing protein [Mycena alexandri]
MAKFNPIDVTVPHIVYAALGGFVVLFGMFSLFLREKLYVGEACWAFLFGVVIGPYGANIFNPRGWGGDNDDTVNMITLELARVVLAIGVFAIGVELPKAYMRRHWKSLFFLLGPVMIWGWFVSAALIFALIPGLNFLSSLAVAACLTPTDPILAAAVVGGKYADKHVPAHIRHLLAAESGCNDGAAFPFLYIALYLILDSTTKEAIQHWFLELWLYQVILGVVIGSLIGFSFRYLMKFSERHSLIDRHSYVAQYVSLALLTIGLTTLLGSDDLLSAFACGAAFAWDGFFNRQTEESVFSSVIDLLFNVAAFVYVGAWMPFASFQDPAHTTLQVWRLVVLAICILLLRRLPIMVALYRWIPDIKTAREAVFSGHFGPIGVGAVFISTLATQVLVDNPRSTEDPQVALLAKTIQPICAFMVLCSITIHGLSIPSFSLGRRVHSVSRTWSRHTTATHQPQPDWMDHVRHAGGGVVVNRDHPQIGDAEAGSGDLEMGLGSGEKVTLDGRPQEDIDVRVGRSESPTAVGTTPGSSDEEKEQAQKEADVEAGRRPEGDVPPDGEELIAEWQEGHHRIIERRAGPGEEVEVEVIRNVDGNDVSSAYRGSEAVVHRLVEKIRSAPRAIEMDLEALGHSIEERLGHSPVPGHHHLHAQVTDPAVGPDDEDDEEGWASDRSDGPAAGPSTSADRGSRRMRSKSPKAKPTGRRRGSVTRKGLLRMAHEFINRDQRAHGRASTPDILAQMSPSVSSSSESPTPPDETHQRPLSTSDSAPQFSATDYAYRRPGISTSSSRADISSVRHGRRSRVDSLRLQHSTRPSREASPARSVRFAEPTGSGASTPRTGVFGEEVHASPAAVDESGEDMSRSVTFDLPDPEGGSGSGSGRSGPGSGSSR